MFDVALNKREDALYSRFTKIVVLTFFIQIKKDM